MSDQFNKQEIDMLREELEILMRERASLLHIVGAAAMMVADTDARQLSLEAAEAAEMLSKSLNKLPEETLKDALENVHATTSEQ